MINYYDLVLGLIPLVFAGIASVLAVAGLTASMAAAGGALAVLPLVGHAMFVRAPETPTGSDPEPSADATTQSGLQTAD